MCHPDVLPKRQTKNHTATCYVVQTTMFVASPLSNVILLYTFSAEFLPAQLRPMAPKIDPAPWIDALGLLASVAEAAPALEELVEGSIKALGQILLYTEVSSFE
jgi:hypothetical protein